MAENKKSFILYTDLIHSFEGMTDDEAGKLIKHLLRYVNDLNPEPIDRVTGLLFEPIKQQLKRDLEKWSNERKGRSDAGKKGMEKRWADHNKQKQEITKDNNVIENITNITDNVSVSVNVSDSVSVKKKKKDISPEVKKLRGDCREFFKQHYHGMKGTEYYWVAKDAAALISLISQIRLKIKEKKNTDQISNEDLFLGFQLVINNISDAWILNNYSITNISSKFNEIYTKIKHGNNTKTISKYHN